MAGKSGAGSRDKSKKHQKAAMKRHYPDISSDRDQQARHAEKLMRKMGMK